MKITLVVTGADRYNDLRRFFKSLSSQYRSNYEIQLIFVNQGDFNPKKEFEFLNTIDYVEKKSQKIPLSAARNIGLAYAKGDVLAFPDDDCWYPSDLIERVVNYFESHPNTDAICTNVFDPMRQRTYGGRPLERHILINFFNLFELPISVGIFVRRDAFEAAGYHFDEQLGAGTLLGSGEETDLIYRLLKKGAQIEYTGSIQVFHPVPEYQEMDVAKYYRYGLGFGYLNGRIVRDGEWRVLTHMGYVLLRSLGGSVVNLPRAMQRRLYWSRFVGIVQGFLGGFISTRADHN